MFLSSPSHLLTSFRLLVIGYIFFMLIRMFLYVCETEWNNPSSTKSSRGKIFIKCKIHSGINVGNQFPDVSGYVLILTERVYKYMYNSYAGLLTILIRRILYACIAKNRGGEEYHSLDGSCMHASQKREKNKFHSTT